MRCVELIGTSIRCSALGFGTANLMGRVNRRQSLWALNEAFDHGITIFDTARSYGWGESEAVLGEFARGRRGDLTIITKLGIFPPPRNRLRQALKPVVRGLLGFAGQFQSKRITTAIRGQIQKRVASQVQHGRFDVATARASLDASLKALRTDYVDILLLHSPKYEQIADGATIGFLEEAVRSGKVRAIGASTDADNANRIATEFPSIQIVQLENNLLMHQIDALQRRNETAIITNSPFGSRSLLDRLAELAITAPAEAARWAEQTGIDIRQKEGVGQLLLSYAFVANPNGVVLCGMHTAEHIAQNAALAASVPPTSDVFWQTVEEIRRLATSDRCPDE